MSLILIVSGVASDLLSLKLLCCQHEKVIHVYRFISQKKTFFHYLFIYLFIHLSIIHFFCGGGGAVDDIHTASTLDLTE